MTWVGRKVSGVGLLPWQVVQRARAVEGWGNRTYGAQSAPMHAGPEVGRLHGAGKCGKSGKFLAHRSVQILARMFFAFFFFEKFGS